jgi:hypothetical protein
MRMPVISYFVVMSVVLTAVLIIVSTRMEPQPHTIAASQIEGVQKPYTAEPEPSYRVTATNFAAPRKMPTDALARANDKLKPAPPPKAKRKQDNDDDQRSGPAWGRIADYPINGMMAIH